MALPAACSRIVSKGNTHRPVMRRDRVRVTKSHSAKSGQVTLHDKRLGGKYRSCEAKNREAGGLKTNRDRLEARDKLCCMVEYSCCAPIYSQELRLHIYIYGD